MNSNHSNWIDFPSKNTSQKFIDYSFFLFHSNLRIEEEKRNSPTNWIEVNEFPCVCVCACVCGKWKRRMKKMGKKWTYHKNHIIAKTIKRDSFCRVHFSEQKKKKSTRKWWKPHQYHNNNKRTHTHSHVY